jgi:hypothetical protein
MASPPAILRVRAIQTICLPIPDTNTTFATEVWKFITHVVTSNLEIPGNANNRLRRSWCENHTVHRILISRTSGNEESWLHLMLLVKDWELDPIVFFLTIFRRDWF